MEECYQRANEGFLQGTMTVSDAVMSFTGCQYIWHVVARSVNDIFVLATATHLGMIWTWLHYIYIYMICCNIETCAFREYKYFTVYSYTYLCFLAESGPHIYEARLPKCLRLQWTCIYIYIFSFLHIYICIYIIYIDSERERDATSLRVFNTWETLEAFGTTKCIESWVFT